MVAENVAVVVGAGGTIGGACARELAAGRDAVACVDVDVERAQRTAAAIDVTGTRTIVVAADASAEDFSGCVLASLPAGSIVTAAVHAVAHEEHIPAADVSRHSMLRSYAMGPLAAFTLFRDLMCGGHLTRGSALTAIGSLHADHPFADCIGYNAGHGALAQIVKTLAHEWAALGIRVNAVVPGWIRTDAETAFYGHDHLNRVEAGLPLGRFGSAEDIAAAVGFLSSASASYVSGSSLTVDGALSVSLARLPQGEKA
jgi:NAD(P)-dependent dehydrogenase (short-subunit alcohol dehydrogenase family)